jgi:hypothetical protein
MHLPETAEPNVLWVDCVEKVSGEQFGALSPQL